MSTATVYIVGAGPGDPELLTRKAYRLLQEADAVVYDRLVSEAIIALIPAGALRIFAGKSCREHSMSQEEINRMLLALTKRKHRIVRLNGVDPFTFGRGGVEAMCLARHHIAFEIVPGITAASGCATYAGIPLTHRGLASGLRYVTGHKQKNGALDLNWKSLADPDTTLVFYMALNSAQEIAQELIAAGLAATTPVAAIREGTTAHQERAVATLDTIACRIAQWQPPATLIIGRVAALAGSLDWFSNEQAPVTSVTQHSYNA